MLRQILTASRGRRYNLYSKSLTCTKINTNVSEEKTNSQSFTINSSSLPLNINPIVPADDVSVDRYFIQIDSGSDPNITITLNNSTINSQRFVLSFRSLVESTNVTIKDESANTLATYLLGKEDRVSVTYVWYNDLTVWRPLSSENVQRNGSNSGHSIIESKEQAILPIGHLVVAALKTAIEPNRNQRISVYIDADTDQEYSLSDTSDTSAINTELEGSWASRGKIIGDSGTETYLLMQRVV